MEKKEKQEGKETKKVSTDLKGKKLNTFNQKVNSIGFPLKLGFFEGVFLRIGIDPEGTIIDALVSAVSSMPYLNEFGVLIPFLIFIMGQVFIFAFLIQDIARVYHIGKYTGFLVMILAFIAGYILISEVFVGIISLFAAALIWKNKSKFRKFINFLIELF